MLQLLGLEVKVMSVRRKEQKKSDSLQRAIKEQSDDSAKDHKHQMKPLRHP